MLNNTINYKQYTILLLLSLFHYYGNAQLYSPPGNITSDLELWYDAEDINGDSNLTNNPADGSAITLWVDKSGNGNNATVQTGKDPAELNSSVAELVNGNPFVKFNRVSRFDGTILDTGLDIRSGAMEDFTLFIVYKPKTIITTGSIADRRQAPWGVDNGGWDRFYYSSFIGGGSNVNGEDGIVSLGTANASNFQIIPEAGKVDELYLLTVAYNGNVNGAGTANNGPTNGSAVYFNGDLVTTFTDTSNPTNAITELALGWDGDDGAYDGQIGDVLVYSRILTDCEIEEINRDIGLKYGKDFSGFSASYDDTTDFFNNVNAIGIATSSCTTTVQVDEAISSNVTINNPSSNDTNNEFLIFAHNSNDEDAISTDIPSGATYRLDRVWAVEEETNTNINGPTIELGTVDVTFDVSLLGLSNNGINDFYLLVDNNRTTSNVLSDSNIVATGTYDGLTETVIFTGIDLEHQDLFTLAVEDNIVPTVTLEQEISQNDPDYLNNTATANFTIVFNEAIDVSTFTCTDLVNTGTATATCTSITQVTSATLNNTTFEIVYTATSDGTVVLDLPANTVADFAGNLNTASVSIDNSVTIKRRRIITNRGITYRVLKGNSATPTTGVPTGNPTTDITLNGELADQFNFQLSFNENVTGTINGQTWEILISNVDYEFLPTTTGASGGNALVYTTSKSQNTDLTWNHLITSSSTIDGPGMISGSVPSPAGSCNGGSCSNSTTVTFYLVP